MITAKRLSILVIISLVYINSMANSVVGRIVSR